MAVIGAMKPTDCGCYGGRCSVDFAAAVVVLAEAAVAGATTINTAVVVAEPAVLWLAGYPALAALGHGCW